MDRRSRDLVKAYALGFCRFCLIWFGTLAVGFPLVVLALGFHLREGWNLIAEHPNFFILLSLFPFPLLAIGLVNGFIQRRFPSLPRRERHED